MTESSIAIMILFGTLIVLMFIRIPIAFSLGISAVVTALYMDIPLMNLFMKMVTSLQNFVIVACPFFVIMAQVMGDGGITKRLMKFCQFDCGQNSWRNRTGQYPRVYAVWRNFRFLHGGCVVHRLNADSGYGG